MRAVGEPERLSALNGLTKCSGLVAVRATEVDSVSGTAADTGTGVGRGVELWHRGNSLTALQGILAKEAPTAFPKADMTDVARIVERYCNDPRNRPEVVVTSSLEQTVTLSLGTYTAVGHLDQIRYNFPYEKEREHLGFTLWDVKNGAAEGETMLGDYAYQLAAYTLAAAPLYEGLSVGGVIRTKGYITRGKPAPGTHSVFFHAGWKVSDCRAILSTVEYLIGEIRQGRIPHTPGAHCRYCPLDFPNCTSNGVLSKHLRKVEALRLPCVTKASEV
jgi:hypothetical protein